MCLVGHRAPLGRRSASLDPASFRRLLDELPDLESVTLQGLGEPLLAPGLLDMVSLAKARSVQVGFNTNGMLLDARQRRALLDLEVDWVHVSVDAATPAVFEAIRPGASFERIVGNLRALVVERGSRRRPRVQLNSVLMRRTLGELAPLLRLAAELGVDRLWVQQLSHDLSDTTGRADFESLRAFTEHECLWSDEEGLDRVDVRRALRDAARLASELGIEVRLPDVDEEPSAETRDPSLLPCDWPWRSSYVNHDGRVQPCCMLMGDDRGTMGHSGDAGGFDAVWHGETYVEFRRRLLSPDPPEVCRGCAQYHRRF
jgi:MoaA/NifB/PqqE/SkfB family radical SAM enzyme